MATNLIRRGVAPVVPSIDRLFGAMLADPFFASMEPAGVDEGTLAIDVSEDDAHVIVRASLPGFTKEQVHVEVHDGVLSIKAEKSEEQEESTERFYRRERRVGSVSRRVALPGIVEDGRAEAELKDGVLTLRLAKPEKASPKRIQIR